MRASPNLAAHNAQPLKPYPDPAFLDPHNIFHSTSPPLANTPPHERVQVWKQRRNREIGPAHKFVWTIVNMNSALVYVLADDSNCCEDGHEQGRLLMFIHELRDQDPSITKEPRALEPYEPSRW